MKIEQPANLNRFVDPTIPLTWSKRWEIVRPLFPLLVACAILMVEMIALRLWLDGQSVLLNWPRLVVAPLLIMAVLLGGIELQLRLRHRTKRWLKLDALRITTQQGLLPWKRLVSWRLEPVPDEPSLRKLTVEHRWSKKASRTRSIVLQHPEHTQILKSEVEHLRQRNITEVPLVELAESLPTPKRRRIRGMVAVALGFYLFIHGCPLLLVGLTASDKPAGSKDDTRPPSPGVEKLGRLLAKHFSSAKQLRIAFVFTGAVLTGTSLACYVWGLHAARKEDNDSACESLSPEMSNANR